MKDSMQGINIAIIEDDDKIREGLAFVINNTGRFNNVYTFSSGEEVLQKITGINPDIVLMDIGLPGMTGIECLKKMKQIRPSLSVVMLTVFEDSEQVFNSIMAGASGYILKKTPSSKLVELLEELYNGGAPMSAQIARRVLEFFQSEPPSKGLDELSNREVEVLNELVRGYTSKQIAEKLFISSTTVRDHLKSIYQKLHVHTRSEAVAKTLRFNPLTKK